MQVETPQAVLGADGTALVARMVHAAGGRLTGLHYGTYDYRASCGIAAAHQASDHPAADHAKLVMQVAVAGTGARLSTARPTCCRSATRDAVHAAWRLHAGLVRRGAGTRLLPGLGPAPGPAGDPVRGDLRLLPRRAAAAAARLAAYVEQGAGGVARRAGDRPRAGRRRAARAGLRRRGRRGGRARARGGDAG